MRKGPALRTQAAPALRPALDPPSCWICAQCERAARCRSCRRGLFSSDSRMSTQRFASFHEFYPFYLREHSSRASRRLHVIGTALALVLLIVALATRRWNLLWAVPL